MCGFGSLALSKNIEENQSIPISEQDTKLLLSQEWIASLLQNLNNNVDQEKVKKIVKANAIVHYRNLKMDDMLTNHIGNIEGFIDFISNEWGWKVEYNKETRTIIADESKPFCVCPMINQKNGVSSSAICYCSEGFAEKMFSTVAGVPASATVISSVLRGDKTCKYRIALQ